MNDQMTIKGRGGSDIRSRVFLHLGKKKYIYIYSMRIYSLITCLSYTSNPFAFKVLKSLYRVSRVVCFSSSIATTPACLPGSRGILASYTVNT